MKKRILIVGLFVAFLCVTGCESKKYTKNLVCTQDNSDYIETYGKAVTRTEMPFSKDGKKFDKVNMSVEIIITEIEVTDEKMKSLDEKIKDRMCNKDGIIPTDCESKIDGKTLTYTAKADYSDIWYNYTGSENLDEIKSFLEETEGMTCKVEEIK